jgi:hypothetical protein
MEVDTGPACIRCAYAVANYRLECRLKPPSPDYKSGGRIFPMMQHDDWCTKYKAKPELAVKPEPKAEPSESLRQLLDGWTEGYDDE